MKKLLLTAIGIGLFAVSCGTKESSMSTSNSDSVNTRAASPTTTDTMTTKMKNPDSIKMKKDSMATPPAK
ncbi:cytochrome C551 [Chryseobacterium sp. c4a]|uniref:cytochrome C551 n=1 Tax=Chryseobacterium sp. c4a TaxID=1573582 RepID=UPI001359BE01|nr:cytochrome C551 [Chryseobacterium sp. c4a]